MTSPSTDRRFGTNSSVAIKAPCRAATTANITLSGEQTVDGVALVTGDRCLVKNQTSGVNNGIYVVDTGSWTRDVDFDGSNDAVTGTLIKITSGTINAGYFGELTTTGTIVVGTTSLTFAMRSGSGTTTLTDQQIQNQTAIWAGTAGGTADVITLTVSPAITSYVAGQTFRFVSSGANTTNVTANVSGLGAKALTKSGTNALVAGDIPSGAELNITYDGTQFQLGGGGAKSFTPLAPTASTYAPASGAQTVALDVSANNIHQVTGNVNGTAITFTITGATNSQPFIVSVLQGGTTLSTITAWFATIRWVAGTIPTLTATLNKRDTFGFIRTGANTYDGFVIGQNC